MEHVLYERNKTHTDRTVRCYLSLACPGGCKFCAALVPKLPAERKEISIAPGIWAEGINRRARPVILCGGEPLIYPGLRDLLLAIDKNIKVEMFSNLIASALPAMDRPMRWLVSLHPVVTPPDRVKWYEQITALQARGHSIRFHVVKVGDWEARRDFLKARGPNKVTCCDDQGSYVKSVGVNPGPVTCRMVYFVFGPDGYRYPCVTKLGLGESPAEHISDADGPDAITVSSCRRFSTCAACDNLAEGKTWIASEEVADNGA